MESKKLFLEISEIIIMSPISGIDACILFRIDGDGKDINLTGISGVGQWESFPVSMLDEFKEKYGCKVCKEGYVCVIEGEEYEVIKDDAFSYSLKRL